MSFKTTETTKFTEGLPAQNNNQFEFTFWRDSDVRFTDLDVLGHVNSVRYHDFFATLRTQFFIETIPDWPNCNPVPVLKTASIEHIGEVIFPAQLRLGLNLVRFGNSSFDLKMGLFFEENLKAVSENRFVFVDREKKASASLPKSFIDNVKKGGFYAEKN